MKTTSKTAGIKDIAKALGISIGTVDRVLHERTGVSLKTKARVQQMAEQLGYKPNLAAQALKLNRRIEIAVVLPKQISHFFDPLRSGIRAAAAATVGLHVDAAAARGTLAIGDGLAGRDADAIREFKAAIPILMSSSRENADDERPNRRSDPLR